MVINPDMLIYCICLPNRRTNCDMFFEKLGVVPIYTTVTLTAEIAHLPEFVTSRWKDTKGALACAMSHRTACQALLDTDEQLAVVFEDDNDIPDSSRIATYHALLAELRHRVNDFNYVNLSPCDAQFPPRLSSLKLRTLSNIRLHNASGWCANAYIISREGARLCLEMKWKKQHDYYLKSMPKAFDVHPRLFQQNSQPSSIGHKACPPEYTYTCFIAVIVCAVIGITAIVVMIICLKV